jgi:tetratricopeptide (TPR) repeat protein
MMSRIPTLCLVIGVEIAFSACSDLPGILILHDPLTPEEHVTLALTYEIEKPLDLAVQEYEGAVRQKQGYVSALIGLGNLAFERGAVNEAEEHYRRALTTDPEDPGANNNLAMLYLTQRKKLDEAERLASLALAQGGPLQPYVLDTMAHIYAVQGKHREAQTALSKAEVLAPSYDRALHQRLAQLQQELAAVRP